MTVCTKCGQEIVLVSRFFWGLPSEEGTGRAMPCPVGPSIIHDPDEEDD